jgi:nuclear transcription Y subunit beta
MEATATEPPVIREQDRLMPIANVVRVMRRVLPPHAKVSDEAKELIQECVSEFISFITGEANERCRGEHRKTVTAEDVVWAMERLGFDDYVTPLEAFVQRMRDSDGTRAQTRVQVQHAPPPPVPVAGMQGQAHPVAFPNATLPAAHGHAVPVQVQHNMLGGERSAMAAAYYGAPPAIAEEETSSSNAEEPAAATCPRLQNPN